MTDPVRVGKNLINFPSLKRGFVISVFDADNEFFVEAFVENQSVKVTFDLEFLAADALSFVPAYLSQSGGAIDKRTLATPLRYLHRPGSYSFLNLAISLIEELKANVSR